MKRLVGLVVIAACGHHGDGGGSVDVDGGGDATTDARSTVVDAISDSGTALDPTSCPIGVADGCCPIAVQFGGSDPDCPSLGCTLGVSDPIALDDWQDTGLTGVGMAWTGSELVLAWPGVGGTSLHPNPTVVLQRRDASGALTFGPMVHDDLAAPFVELHATPELGFEPASRSFLLAASTLYQRYAETLDASGAPTSAPTKIGVDCNPIMARYQIYPWQGTFLVAQDNDPCSSEEWHGARVDAFTTAGARTSFTLGDAGIYQLGMTYDAAHGRVVFSGDNAALTSRTFTPPTTWTPSRVLSNIAIYDTGIAFDGTNFLAVYGTYYLNAVHQISSDPMAGVWSIDADADASPVAPAYAVTTGANRQTVAPRMVWTGAGWLELTTSYPWENQGLPASWSTFSTSLINFATDGALRQMLPLDPDHPTYLVNAIWAGGKVAITYVTPDNQGHERRYLRYAACAM